jgi:hypothetical protein
MLGFLFGSVLLFAMFALLRSRHFGFPPFLWGRRLAYGYGGCGRGWAGDRWSSGGGRSLRGGRLRWLFERLETTPGQERIFLAAAEQLKGSKQRIKEELERSRRDLAQVFRGEQFSQAAIREILARHEVILGELRETAVEALAKIDEALDERQRKLLADLIESGPRFRAGRAAPDRYI